MYVESITIRNFRCFRRAQLNLQYLGKESASPLTLPNVNLLLGNNGMGKTSTLRALALAVLSPIMPQSGYLPYRLVRSTGPKDHRFRSAHIDAEILCHPQDVKLPPKRGSKVIKMSVDVFRQRDIELLVPDKKSQSRMRSRDLLVRMFDDESAAFLIVGYGSSRHSGDSRRIDEVSRRKARLLRYERVASLVESYVSFTPLSYWLPEIKKRNRNKYQQVIELVNELMPEDASFEGYFEGGEYYFEIGGNKVPFAALSDGYQAYLGWITDLLYHVSMSLPRSGRLIDAYGLVLVDEIDLHLHPEWQRSVVPTISKAFPKLQFVFSTHSPIVAGTVNRENIFVMEEETERGHKASVVKQYQERIFGLDAEQALLSSYFGLLTTRAEPFVDELRELSIKAGQGDVKAARRFMQELIGASVDIQRIRGNKGQNKKVDVHKRPRAGKKRSQK